MVSESQKAIPSSLVYFWLSRYERNSWDDCIYVCWWNRHRHRHRHRHRWVVPPLTWHPADVLVIRLHFISHFLRDFAGLYYGPSQPLKGSILKSCEVVLWVSLSPKMFNLAPCLGWLLHSLASEGAVLQVSTREHFSLSGMVTSLLGIGRGSFTSLHSWAFLVYR